MTDTGLAYAVQNLDLQRLQHEQLVLYNTYTALLEHGTHAQLCAKAKEVIKAREKTNKKIDWMNCDATCVAVCFIVPLLCLDAMLKEHDYEADEIATGLYAEHVPLSYKRCGAITEPHRPKSVREVPMEVAAPLVAQQRPSMTLTESSHEMTTASPFALLDNALERAFAGLPKAAATAPVVKVLKIDGMSDMHVIEEIAHGLMDGSVVIVLTRAVVDRRLPELLLEETGRAVCWDVFRMEARRVPEKFVDASIVLRIFGEGKFVLFTNEFMTVLGGFLSGGIFVLGTFRMVAKGEPERDFILNCYRNGSLCRVYYTKVPRGALKVREFFQETLIIDITPLPQGQFYDIHDVA